jgi:D-alanyl-D-alanine carboxypeptidase/D-alanyl-D-alanine-endopeptidase (penicillin-binding protein 4)
MKAIFAGIMSLSMQRLKRLGYFKLCTVLLSVLLGPINLSYAASLDKYAKGINKIDKASLLVPKTDKDQAVSIRPEQLLVPASTLKVVTAYLAINRWGLEHKFYTDFYYDNQTLWIKGFGDPYITSEEIATMSSEIKKLKLGKVKRIRVDNSFFPELILDGRGDSDNPYDAGNAALVVNFNTLYIEKSGGTITSAEKQTPITPLAKQLAANIGQGKKRISLPGGRDMSAQYFGEVYSQLHFKRNISVKVQSVPKSAEFIYRHYSSRKMEDLLSAMLKYSNNFIANQLFLMLPELSEQQAVLDVSAAQTSYTKLLENEFAFKGASFVDGAGLSRLNQISSEQLLQVLEKFRPWIYLLPERLKGLKAKTGTLSDNHSLAGYVLDKNEQWQAFVLLINKRMPYNYRFEVAQALLKK